MMSPTRSLNSVKIKRLLGAADLLHEGLLGILGGDAAEAGRGDFDFDLVAELGVGLDAAGVEHGNLVVLGDDLVGDDELGEGADVAGFGFDGDAQFAGGADGLLGGGEQRLLDGGSQDITADALFLLPEFQDC